MNYVNCTLCPRRCGIDRTAGQRGFCRCPDTALVAKTMVHRWEEPALAGAGGSGAGGRLLKHLHSEIGAAVRIGPSPGHVERPVGGIIVDHNQVDRPVGLGQHRVERAHQQHLPVVHRNDHRYRSVFTRCRHSVSNCLKKHRLGGTSMRKGTHFSVDFSNFVARK